MISSQKTMDNNTKDKKLPTSGYTEDIAQEMEQISSTSLESGFTHLKEHYVSKTGHTRLFSATKYGKRYMLKCLKEDFLFTPIYHQALAKEFEIGLQMEHPHICRTIGMENLPKLGPTIIMEYIDGEDLQELLDKGLVSKDLAKKITSQLLDALEYLHNKQVIHRDLKPSNIMITHNGHNMKLIDFSLSDSDAFCILKSPAGTYGYIAPEQLQEGAYPDIRADIYSLGKVIGDMAVATKDKLLLELAIKCTYHDINHRPTNIAVVRQCYAHNLFYTRMIRLLSFIAVALILFIAFSLTYKHNKVKEPAPSTMTADSLSDGNQILDYSSLSANSLSE